MLAIALAGATTPVQAVVALFDWGYNIDGTMYDSFPSTFVAPGESDGFNPPAATLPASIDDSAFDYSSGGNGADPGGLGTIRVTIVGTGAHSVGVYLDHEIDEGTNTYFNEGGAFFGTPAPGQSWEIDKPSSPSPPFNYDGDIIANFFDPLNADNVPELDNSIFLDVLFNTTGTDPSLPGGPVDVAMAMAWDFVLADGETAFIDFIVSEVQPNGGFYLQHSDLTSDRSIYFYSTLSIQGLTSVPAPATLALLALGLAGVAARRRMTRGEAGC